MTADADRAAHALLTALRLMMRSLPGMYEKPVSSSVVGLVSGLPLPTLNGVFTDADHPDLAEISSAAASMAGLAVPWSIQLRGEPTPELERLAAEYGLTARTTEPLMLYRPVPGQHLPPAREAAADRIVVAGLADQFDYAAGLAAGFEAPPEIMAPFSAPEVFTIPGVVPYLAREDNGDVATVGLGVFTEGIAGVFNIATPPAYRGRGYGRAVTSRIVADGIARGAGLAYLLATEAGYPLYQSMGFRTVENMTYLMSGERTRTRPG